MKCPNCGKTVGDHDAICPACGAEMFIDTKLAEKIFKKNEEPMPDDEKPKKGKKLAGKFKFDLHKLKG